MIEKKSSFSVKSADGRVKIEWYNSKTDASITLYADKVYTLPDKEKGA